MINTTGIITSLLERSPGLSLLCIGSSAVDTVSWSRYTNRMAIVSSHRPSPIDTTDFTFLLSTDTVQVSRNLQELARRGQRYDVIHIDHDHRLMALYEQIELTLALAHPESLFLFDDAVPPSYDMATPAPTKGWWTGQVCYLRQLLRKKTPDAILECVKLPPTGLLLAQGFSLAPKTEFEACRGNAPNSDAELEEITKPAAWGDIEDAVHAGLERLAYRTFMPITLADDSLCSAMQILDPAAIVDRRPPAFVCLACRDQSLPGIERLQITDRKRHEKRLYTYDQAMLVGHDYILKDKHIAPRYFRDDVGHSMLQRVGREYGTFLNDSSGIKLLHGSYTIDTNHLSEPERLNGHVLLATPDEPMNYGMWLLLTIPSVFEFLGNRDRYDKLLCHCPRPWQKMILETVGVDMADVIEHDLRRTYHCERLSLIRASYRDLMIPDGDRESFRRFAERVAGNFAPVPGKRVFLSRLSRTQIGAYRGLVNEVELIRGMANLGFEIVEPEGMSFVDQVRLFHETDVLVGLGGAGMFNAVFCQPKTRLVSIESSMVFLDAHCNIFASMDLDYAVIIGEVDPTDPRPSQKRWSLDVDQAVRAIADFIC